MSFRDRLPLLLAVLAFTGPVATLAHSQPAAKAPPAPPHEHGAQTLSTEELAQLKAILAPYQAASLKVDDAKAIKRALRDARIRPGLGLAEALRAQGFSAERLEQLDPRPPGPPPGEGPGRPDGPPPRGENPPPARP